MNSPKEIAQNYIATGATKVNLPVSKMLLLGILAGMFIALAGVGSTLVPVTVLATPLASVGRLLGAMVFPTGLAMVLISGSELFTGNNLIIIPVLQKEVKVQQMLKNWFYVYIGNFIGSILIAALTVYGGTYNILGNEAGVAVINVAMNKVSMSWTDVLLQGILCNFLVCIAVWMSFAAKDIVGRVAALYLPIMLFVLSGYEHSIANMYFIPAGIFAKGNLDFHLPYINQASAGNLADLNWLTLWTKNLIPSTLGNIIGGMILVGAAYWFIYLRDPAAKGKK